jgi:hypothetical protein
MIAMTSTRKIIDKHFWFFRVLPWELVFVDYRRLTNADHNQDIDTSMFR